MPLLRIVDSVTELGPHDAGCIAVTGSHGGVSSARFAQAARPLLCVFNDAGVGREAAGVAGLALLQAQGIAACAVLHSSARIGDAHSTLNDGIIGHANALAASLGVQAGQRCAAAVATVQNPSQETE
ncbi:hypothetical protein FN976_26635 [Caenimonas sedimenti]|uniref:Uncharacterized protein n=1 Tax=Caenimonas sedimenti TaxID=2596921 RepID=A0A562ZFT5_9BURK|nr:hypothetical protein [Caenimonas sedimenti]TWO66127.1 hypothetical protein FN976_26635 [Caenimonas sedimenti]